MILLPKEQYSKMKELVSKIAIETAYPSSIINHSQKGWIYVDSIEQPSKTIIFHFCGFIYLVGFFNEQELSEFKTLYLLHCKTEGKSFTILLELHDTLLARLQTCFSDIPEMKLIERDLFQFKPDSYRNISSSLPNEFELCNLDAFNIPLLQGRIIPSFSFQTTQEFLTHGFGVGIRELSTGNMAGCAFSSAVGSNSIDIGIEVAPNYRGMGFATILANAMVYLTLEQNKLPEWGCNSSNLGSSHTAKRCGFDFHRQCIMYRLCME